MIQSEKELEDYICNNQDEFIQTLKSIFGEDEDIKFVGNQVKVGQNNVVDLLYCFDTKNLDTTPRPYSRSFIVVELKFRQLEPKDLAQLQRYMNSLSQKIQEKSYNEYYNYVYGVFVSLGETLEMQNICIADNISDIYYISVQTKLSYNINNWSLKEEYIKNIKLDDRIENLYSSKEENNGGVSN